MRWKTAEKREVLAVTVGEMDIDCYTRLPINDALRFMEELELTGSKAMIADRILKEIRSRLGFPALSGAGIPDAAAQCRHIVWR